MNKFTNALVITFAAVSIPALADDAQRPTVAEKPGISKPGDVSPPVAQAMVDDVEMGIAVAKDGRVPTESRTDDFLPGENIYLTMDVSDATPGTKVRVVWIGPGEQRIAVQNQTVAEGVSTLKFVNAETRAWKPGDYRAEVWVGDEKVNDESFNVVSARSARN